jgi:DNA-binding transcriptional regulator YhcF (GntR family)
MITIDATSFVPAYEQVRSQLAEQIASRELHAGTRLPTVRQLARDLGLAVNTVARSYKDLEAAGLVATRGRGGTVVTSAGDHALARLQESAQHLADLSRSLGFGEDDVIGLLHAAFGSTTDSSARTVRH